MKNTTKYGIGALVLLVAGYFVYSKNKKITSLPATLPASTEPVKVDREKLALEYTEKNFVPSPFDSGSTNTQFQSNGLQILSQVSNNNGSVSAQPLKPRNKVTFYKDLLDTLNKITDDNDVLLFLDNVNDDNGVTLKQTLIMEKLSKKYPTIKFD